MDISNRALGLLLIAAIVVSIGGTFISLDRLDAVSTTGFATNNQTGQVDITITESLSIIIVGAAIDFGDCTLSPGEVLIMDSEYLGANKTLCNGFTVSTPLKIENDGNVNANVSIQVDKTAETIFTDAASTFKYKTVVGSANNGCVGTMEGTYIAFAGINTEYNACSNLTFGANKFFDTHIQIGLSEVAQTGTATIEYFARAIN